MARPHRMPGDAQPPKLEEPVRALCQPGEIDEPARTFERLPMVPFERLTSR